MPFIEVDATSRVTTLTLSRPEALNAMNRALLDELHGKLDDVAAARTARAVVIAGAGGKAFSAGADLKERAGMTPEQTRAFLARIRGLMDKVERLPMPVIAAIDGFAFGGGCELALACDLRVMTSTSTIGLTETALGIIPGAGGTQRLPRIVGVARAKELIFTARKISADEALRIGLVNHVVAPGQAMAKAIELAAEIAKNAPVAVEAAKAAIDGGLTTGISEGTLLEQRAYEVTLYTEDRREALKAFAEKRPPVFQGR